MGYQSRKFSRKCNICDETFSTQDDRQLYCDACKQKGYHYGIYVSTDIYQAKNGQYVISKQIKNKENKKTTLKLICTDLQQAKTIYKRWEYEGFTYEYGLKLKEYLKNNISNWNKTCPICEKKFYSNNKNRKYCSKNCAKKAQAIQLRNYCNNRHRHRIETNIFFEENDSEYKLIKSYGSNSTNNLRTYTLTFNSLEKAKKAKKEWAEHKWKESYYQTLLKMRTKNENNAIIPEQKIENNDTHSSYFSAFYIGLAVHEEGSTIMTMSSLWSCMSTVLYNIGKSQENIQVIEEKVYEDFPKMEKDNFIKITEDKGVKSIHVHIT